MEPKIIKALWSNNGKYIVLKGLSNMFQFGTPSLADIREALKYAEKEDKVFHLRHSGIHVFPEGIKPMTVFQLRTIMAQLVIKMESVLLGISLDLPPSEN